MSTVGIYYVHTVVNTHKVYKGHTAKGTGRRENIAGKMFHNFVQNIKDFALKISQFRSKIRLTLQKVTHSACIVHGAQESFLKLETHSTTTENTNMVVEHTIPLSDRRTLDTDTQVR